MKYFAIVLTLLLISSTAFSFDFSRQSTTALETMEKNIQASTQTGKKTSERIIETPIQPAKLARGIGPDGNCTIIGYKRLAGTWVARYHPFDPDCPPN